MRAATPSFDEMLYTRTSAWFGAGLGLVDPDDWAVVDVTLDAVRGRLVVGVAGGAQRLPPEQQEDDSEEQQHHHHGPQGKPRRIGDALIHRPPL